MPTVNSLTESFNPLKIVEEFSESDRYAAELMRNKVSEIIGSYHHQYDHFYESIQNAVDACEKAFYLAQKGGTSAEYTPLINVKINLTENSLTVIDNGLGMAKEEVLKYFFTPYATLKTASGESEIRQRGEKGVGSSFLSYGSNYVHLTTRSPKTDELTSGELKNGLQWCTKKIDLLPMPVVEPCVPHSEILEQLQGTAVTIYFSEDTNMVSLVDRGENIKEWEPILLLYTALGFIDFQGTDEFLKSLRATLTVVKKNGAPESKSLKTGYLYPHLTTEANVRLSVLTRDIKGQLPEAQRDMNIVWDEFTYDQVGDLVNRRMEKMRYLRSAKRERLSNILNEHKPEAYVAFTYGADYWEERNHEIWGQEKDGEFKHGIIFSTKSQKIGEQKRIDFTFRSGDFSRFFILFNMRDLRGDVGRKSLREEIGEFANFFANAVQKKFTEQDDCLKPSPGPFDEAQETDLEEMKDLAKSRELIPLSGLPFSRIPSEEQDVVAIFFSLLGSGKIRGYEIYASHISRTYDGIGRFKLADSPENRYSSSNLLGIAADKFNNGEMRSPNRCFIEFKFNSDDLVKDVRSGYKRLQDIKWLVCWEIGERHVDEGIGLIDITIPAQINRREYFGVTHLMTEGQDKVFVICLKKVLDILSAQLS